MGAHEAPSMADDAASSVCPYCLYEAGLCPRCSECGGMIPSSDQDRKNLLELIRRERRQWIWMSAGLVIGCGIIWFVSGLAGAVRDFYHPPSARERAIALIVDFALFAPFLAVAVWGVVMSRTTASRMRNRYEKAGVVGSRWIDLVNTINLFLWIPLVPVLLLIPIALLALKIGAF